MSTPRKSIDFWRKGLALMRRENGKASTVQDDRIVKARALLKVGVLTEKQVIDVITDIKTELQMACKSKPLKVAINQELLDRYLKEVYGRRKILPDSLRSAKNACQRAVDALGTLPLTSASIDAIQRQIDRFPGRRQRRLAVNVNSMLKWIGRTDRVYLVRSDRVQVDFLPHDKWGTLIALLPDSFSKYLVSSALHTGCRIGELFAITPFSVKEQGLFVNGQMDQQGRTVKLKNRTDFRFAGVLPEGWNDLKAWAAISQEEKFRRRNENWAVTVRNLCNLRFHDLRHSYAIECLKRGASLTQVAQSLGNSVLVCEKHYAGFGQAETHLSFFKK